MGSIWDNAMTGFMAAAFIPPPRPATHPEKRIRRPVKVLAGCTLSKQTPRPAAVASKMGHNLPPRPFEAARPKW
jgi:hypothetical protein